MTSLNKSVANSRNGNILSMKENWEFIESSVFTQQVETGSYDPIKVVTSKEATPISGNLTFQVSPGSRFVVNDLHNAYLYLDVERTFLILKVQEGLLLLKFFLEINTPLILLNNIESVVMILLSLKI
jgi:hypothetical protein